MAGEVQVGNASRYALYGVGGVVGLAAVAVGGGAAYVGLVLPDAGPVPDITVEVTPERVARGDYLAHHVAGCAYCHSKIDPFVVGHHPPGDPATGGGGMHYGEQFKMPGDVYAPNITPGGLGTWSDGEVLYAITTGVRPDNRVLFPMMGYKRFSHASREDLYSIIAWMRSLEPIPDDVPETHLDMPLPIIFRLAAEPAQILETTPDPTDPVAYGEYLVNLAGCKECHTPSENHEPIPGMEFAGGANFSLDGWGTVLTANITPDPVTGIGAWTEELFLGRFRSSLTLSNLGQPVVKGDMVTPMPWQEFAGMTDDDLKAIWAYLRTVPPVNHPVTKFTPP